MIRKALLLLVLYLCATMSWAAAEEDLLIVHATDMHYLSPQLTDYGPAFMEIVENADGKVTHYTPQMMRAFADEMLSLKPDVIILSGDLTLNGAEQSHRELTEILLPLRQAGIQVLALSGNHDSGTAAYRFGPDGAEPFDSLADEAFDDLYSAFGYADAISRDSASMSYVAQIAPDVWCLLVDVNANGTSGTVHEETLAWAEEQLIRAQDEGITVITVSHQPVLQHSRLFSFGYIINNNSSLLELWEKYHVRLHLSGHLHMQHIARSGELTEIAGSSLAVSPNQYGIVRIQNGRLLDYKTQQLDVAGWAERNGETDPDLLRFAAYSADFFDRTTLDPLTEMFAETGIGSEAQQRMTDLAVRLNREYFAGTRQPSETDGDIALWTEHQPSTFFTYYLQSILDEPIAMNQLLFEDRTEHSK